MEENAKQVAALLKILANPHRLLVLCALEDGEKSVSELCGYNSSISVSALSQHLSCMRNYGLIDFDKRGQNVYYYLSDEKIMDVIHILKKTYCKQ